jgi:putative membrane protein
VSRAGRPGPAAGATASGLAIPVLLWLLVAAVATWSAIAPKDRFTWWLEALPALAVLVLLPALRGRFRLTTLAYLLVAAHAIVLLVGAHYTYAEVPLFDALRDAFALSRNHYDRVGHLMQGFTPAIVAREVLLRRSPLPGSRWLPFLVVCFCLAFSAFYELIEWWVAVGSGDEAVAFLATQGDVWDTQWDMFLALVGATAALAMLSGLHGRQLVRMGFPGR